ncbi:hypothetical protein [Streptococcus intermedius]|uniref:Uncharacterized protein n=1 Tax=Streptococcus intermedius TaxID=1338 RepID=A0AAE8G0G1_STRIT|nr:hypothetical protein [Streptococcus intermedius]EID82655.1 hypothetical protein HMPREF1109_0836 [Streptococcus intermedius SK54 = ATCC 27335]EPH04431.1 hypothetical protein HMPREF1654_00567 [Streptococcus intermedius SK54 = ATCC 27335]PMR92476.1 hypothetical protein C1M49_05685 [Streptococcus intermedius]RSJ23290.1 hypothetical protein D8827_06420 [Streptococcus intermedius]SQH51057.1 Uncharacterised protein [Streptococcus intermedius]
MNNSFNNWNNNAGRDVNIINQNQPEKIATYEPEPIWRSPITMAVLSWIGFLTSIGSLLPLYKFFEPIISWAKNSFNGNIPNIQENQIYLFIFLGLFIFSGIIFSLRKITKNQTRHPLKFNYAISGVNKRLNIEKLHIESCPECGGKLKYYNKPYEWLDSYDENGNLKKRKITKRVPVLECKRNSEHFWYVDPAGTKI